MKTEEDEAFEDIERRQGGGFKAKQAMAADKFIAAEERKVGERYGYVPKLHPSEWMDESAQEPVALVIDGVLVKSELPEKYTGHLYTTPPKREWAGLTDGEVTEGLCRTRYALQTAAAWVDGVEWATEQLKEKNT